MAKADITFRPAERLLKNGGVNHVLIPMHIQGRSAYLTNQRFMRCKQSTSLVRLIGLLSFLFKEKLDKVHHCQKKTPGEPGA